MSTRTVIECDLCTVTRSDTFGVKHGRRYGDAAEMRAVLRNQGWRRYGNRLAPRIRLDVCAQCIPEAAAREPLYEVDR